MNNQEINRRLIPIRSIATLDQEVENEVVRVDADSVTVKSSRTGNERTIPFNDIVNRSTKHGSIIDSFRQVLGL
jgi:predicted DNA binding protein